MDWPLPGYEIKYGLAPARLGNKAWTGPARLRNTETVFGGAEPTQVRSDWVRVLWWPLA